MSLTSKNCQCLILLALVINGATAQESCSLQKADKIVAFHCGQDDLVKCTASATRNQINLDRLRCCVNLAKLDTGSDNYTMEIQQQVNPDIRKLVVIERNSKPPDSCGEVLLIEGLVYNISVSDRDGNKVYDAGERQFDEELDPISKNDTSFHDIAKSSVTVKWHVRRCQTEEEFDLVDNEGNVLYSLNSSCPMPYKIERACYRELTTTLTDLLPHKNYTLAFRHKRVNSQCWSKPANVNFTTSEAEPLIGPEISPGVIIPNRPITVCSEMESIQSLNITLLWKPLDDNRFARGKVVMYSVLVRYDDDNNSENADPPATFLYDRETTETEITIVIQPDVGSSWCTRPFTVSVWSHTTVGKSLDSSNLTLQFDELFQERQFLKFHETPEMVVVESWPDSANFITIYWQENGPTDWSSFYIGNATSVPIIVPIPQTNHGRKKLLGVSADSKFVKKRVYRSAEIIEIPQPTETNTMPTQAIPSSILPIVIMTLTVLILFSVAAAMILYVLRKRSRVSRPGRIKVVPAPYEPILPPEQSYYSPTEDTISSLPSYISSPMKGEVISSRGGSGYTAVADSGCSNETIEHSEGSMGQAYQIDETTSPDESDVPMSPLRFVNTGQRPSATPSAYTPADDAPLLRQNQGGSYQPVPVMKKKIVSGYTPVLVSSSSSSSSS